MGRKKRNSANKVTQNRDRFFSTSSLSFAGPDILAEFLFLRPVFTGPFSIVTFSFFKHQKNQNCCILALCFALQDVDRACPGSAGGCVVRGGRRSPRDCGWKPLQDGR